VTFALTQPLGLLALLSLPLVVWLHRYVLSGPRREVSQLSLWRFRDEPVLEGRTRTRPPPTPVLWLELGAATLLSLLLAGLDVQLPARARRHVGLVVDGTASMGARGGARTPLEDAATALGALGGERDDVVVSLVVARATPHLLGDARMRPDEARVALSTLEPRGGRVRLAPALEMLSGLGVDPASVLIVSDEPALEYRQL